MNATSHPNSANFGTATTLGRLVNQVVPSPGEASRLQSNDQRTLLLGRAIAYRCRDDHDHPMIWLHAELPPQPNVSATEKDVAVERLLAELFDQSRPSKPSSPDPSMAWCTRVNRVLQWTLDRTRNWHPLVRETCILKSLTPYYMACAATQGHCDRHAIAHAEACELMPELVAVVELNRLLTHAGFTDWLCQPERIPYDPRNSIEGAFRVQLPGVAAAWWERIRTTQQLTPLPVPHGLKRSPERSHQGWWSIAWQWSNPQSAFIVPTGWPMGKVSWDQLRSHWKGLYALLNGSQVQDETPLVEIRTAGDAFLGNVLDQMLQDARVDQGLLSIAVVRWLGDATLSATEPDSVCWWQSEFIRCMTANIESLSPRGFVTETGDLALVYRDIDRMELVHGVRDAFAETNRIMMETHHLVGNQPPPIIAGVAAVSAPSRSIQMDQIIDAAWRCLDGAKAQGPGSIKSIEVF